MTKYRVWSPPIARSMNMKPIDPAGLLDKPRHREEAVLAHVSAI